MALALEQQSLLWGLQHFQFWWKTFLIIITTINFAYSMFSDKEEDL